MSEWAEQYPNDFFSVLESKCRSLGFVYHNKCPINIGHRRLVESGLLQSLNDYLLELFSNSCSSMSEAAMVASAVVCEFPWPDDWVCRVGLVTGCAGSGKSRVLKEVYGDDSIILVPNKLMLDPYRGKRVFTVWEMLTKGLEFSVRPMRTLLVDEFTRYHLGEIFFLAAKYGIRNVVLFGDHFQRSQRRNGSILLASIPVLAHSNVSHRIPKHTQPLLVRFGFDIVCEGKNKGVTELCHLYNEEIPYDYFVLAFSDKTASMLVEADISCQLVAGCQGREFDNVCLVVCGTDLVGIDQEELFVGLTRHKKSLRIMADEDALATLSSGELVKLDGLVSDGNSTGPFSDPKAR
uniref:Membrane protein n=1 Tax=Nicotiana velutina mosaic virus TaxID=12292 RepID=Q05149_NVMV|nr:membrane protein [Nicotiana velutina mosaic virus]